MERRSAFRSPVLSLVAALTFVLAGPLAAQGDPMKEVQELARRVDEQLKEIDRLLLETSKPQSGGSSTPKEALRRSAEESKSVEQTMDELIAQLQKAQQQSSSQSQSQDQQQQQQQQGQQQQQDQQQQGQQSQQQQGQRNRQDSGQPEFVQQGDPQQGQNRPGQQQQQEQQGERPEPNGSRPQGGQENPTEGQMRSGQLPPDGATGPGQPGTGSEEWGQLQNYVNHLRNRGSPPKVQDKYRKFWEAYLKSRNEGGKR